MLGIARHVGRSFTLTWRIRLSTKIRILPLFRAPLVGIELLILWIHRFSSFQVKPCAIVVPSTITISSSEHGLGRDMPTWPMTSPRATTHPGGFAGQGGNRRRRRHEGTRGHW